MTTPSPAESRKAGRAAAGGRSRRKADADSAAADQQPAEKESPATSVESERAGQEAVAPAKPGGRKRAATRSSGKTAAAKSTAARGKAPAKKAGASVAPAGGEQTPVDPPAPAAATEGGEEAPSSGGGTRRAASRPVVLVPTRVAEGERISLSVHHDDARMLKLKRIEDGADANARIRALLACYRADAKLQTRVDRLARTNVAPRGYTTRDRA